MVYFFVGLDWDEGKNITNSLNFLLYPNSQLVVEASIISFKKDMENQYLN